MRAIVPEVKLLTTKMSPKTWGKCSGFPPKKFKSSTLKEIFLKGCNARTTKTMAKWSCKTPEKQLSWSEYEVAQAGQLRTIFYTHCASVINNRTEKLWITTNAVLKSLNTQYLVPNLSNQKTTAESQGLPIKLPSLPSAPRTHKENLLLFWNFTRN